MKKTVITDGGGRVHEWVASHTVRDSSFSSTVLGILCASDFHARLADVRYITWLKGITNHKELDAILSILINDANPPSTVSLFISDCAVHRVDVSDSAFAALKQLKGTASALFIISVYSAAPTEWFANPSRSQLIGMRVCTGILECLEFFKPLTFILERLLSGPGIGLVGREISRLLLPLRALPVVKQIPINWNETHYESPITDNDMVRVETACISGSRTVLKSLLPITPAYAACLIRSALTQDSDHTWRVVSFVCHETAKSPDWAVCLVLFASTMDLYLPTRSRRIAHILRWLMREDSSMCRRALVFIEDQMLELHATRLFRDNIEAVMDGIGYDFVKIFIERKETPKELWILLHELHCDNLSSPEYSS